jgi:hypothetical protein
MASETRIWADRDSSNDLRSSASVSASGKESGKSTNTNQQLGWMRMAMEGIGSIMAGEKPANTEDDEEEEEEEEEDDDDVSDLVYGEAQGLMVARSIHLRVNRAHEARV